MLPVHFWLMPIACPLAPSLVIFTGANETQKASCPLIKYCLTKKEKSVKFVVNAIALMCTEDKEHILLQENKKQYANESIFELPMELLKKVKVQYILRRKLKLMGLK